MNPLEKLLDLLRSDVIDLEFVSSDLKDICMTDAEQVERATFDSMCHNIEIDDNRPIGKQVK